MLGDLRAEQLHSILADNLIGKNLAILMVRTFILTLLTIWLAWRFQASFCPRWQFDCQWKELLPDSLIGKCLVIKNGRSLILSLLTILLSNASWFKRKEVGKCSAILRQRSWKKSDLKSHGQIKTIDVRTVLGLNFC